MPPVILSTAYLPNISWFSYFLKNEPVLIEQWEHFEKQSYRNRCEIYSANGPLALSIPLENNGVKEPIRDKRISYAENWQHRHWMAIASAYRNAPYFDYFEQEFKLFYEKRFDLLFDYNQQLIMQVLKILRIDKPVLLTGSYEKSPAGTDLRGAIHPKKELAIPSLDTPYYQVFADRHGFVKNLSIIDLLFNRGLEAKDYLSL